ncbi:MAG: AzlD domain-containing protein [Clostridioides sp.]|jgi:branched-subunit amino acid transport protein|nr:AzlD domain-containing protein [Clostridioides sp.]
MSDKYIYLFIIGMWVVTYFPRAIPLMIFSKSGASENVNIFLKYVPIAIFSSLIAKDIFFSGDTLNLAAGNIKIYAAAIVVLVSCKFKSMGISIAVGVVSIYLLGMI